MRLREVERPTVDCAFDSPEPDVIEALRRV
ncbi:hypothetical protein SAMN05428938_8151 [Streptomyces sp. KS_5]|nr:hypothetical protein SAMN05428938_8151 [Streptomyces sp. KS_5]